jgi:TPR repeat protein
MTWGLATEAAEAAKWFQKAAGQGLVDAQRGLALAYARGDGLEKDMGMAARWYHEAADQGDAVSQRNLGIFYGVGDVGAKDDVQAYMWLILARAQGDDLAGPLLTSLAQRLTPKQIAQADALAKVFKPHKILEAGESPHGNR